MKYLAILAPWVSLNLLMMAITKPILIYHRTLEDGTENVEPMFLFWNLNSYTFSINELSFLAPSYLLIIFLSLISALRAEKLDITSKFLSLTTLFVIISFFEYVYSYPFGDDFAQISSGFRLIAVAGIVILAGLLSSTYYTYLDWQIRLEKKNSTDLYPAIK
ncbi:MAG: hypothetical protein ACXAD7_03545 [Candidatus Kariarchaeaceae archaeon]|jgi:hypothetical protein